MMFKMMTADMWEMIEAEAEEMALALIPDSLCPSCDCLELYEHVEKCPRCGYPNRFMS